MQSKNYIFVRAEIIRPEETLAAIRDRLKQISDENRAAFEAHEREFQDYQTWPAAPPGQTAPARVLDAQ